MGPMLFEQKQQNIINSGNYVENQSLVEEQQQKRKGNRKFSLNIIKPNKIAFNKKINKLINNGTLIAKIYKSPKKCFVTIEKTTSNSYVIDNGDNVMTNIFNGPNNIENRPRWSHVKLSYITKSNKLSCTTFTTDKSILYNSYMPLSNSILPNESIGKQRKNNKSIFKRFNIKSIFKTSFTSNSTIISDTKTITKCENLNNTNIRQEDSLTKLDNLKSTTSLMMFETNDYKTEKISKSSVNLKNEVKALTNNSSDTINSNINNNEETTILVTPRSKRELDYNIPLMLSDSTNNYNNNSNNNDTNKNDCYNINNNSMNCLNNIQNDELFSEEDTYQHHRRRGRLRNIVSNNYIKNNININKNENSKNKITNNIKTNNNNSCNQRDNYYALNNNNNNINNYNYKIIKNLFIDYYNKTLNLLLLLSSLTPLLAIKLSLMKFRNYVTLPTQILSTSRHITSPILWMIGLAIAITILPINLVNASSHSDEQYDLEISYNDNVSYMNGTNATVQRKTPLFPKDLFTPEQLENGAVVLHILGVIYMFVALAIVCDEFFVPSLDVIIEKLGITDDVAGATFMAAGGSAPELFTSVIGVFVSFDDVGIGTIVGSAVFNILFVIGMCALFSKTVLSLTWWPLFRDCSFYSVSLLVLIYFFRDNLIYWWEALVLFFIYIAYVGFMKWNQQVERCVKKVIYKNKGNAANSSETSMATQPGGSVTSRAASESRSGPPGSSSGATGNSSTNAGSTVTGAKFRHGLLQLMIHTIDPLHDGKVDEKATQLHAIASLKVLLDATKPQRGAATTSAANHVKINLKETTLASDRPNGNIDTTLDSGNELEEEPEALSMSWPSTGRKRITYLLVAPIVFPLWLTLPDTRTPRGKKLFPVTFLGSIVWIAAYSYLMVWWANIAGDTAKIPPEVMGLTFLAAGTSIPDLITSVIVARKGFGDMAVSSSVGSNIFDVTVGLPIPWLLFGIIYQQPVEVNSVGMVCSITILFMMLLFVVLSIACFRWRMNRGLGLTMFLLYFVFVAVSLMFEYKIITCPF